MPPVHPAAADVHAAPETVEGWWVLHEAWTLDRAAWRAHPPEWRASAARGLANWLTAEADGHSAAYAVLGQKADLLLVHYRRDADALHAAAAAFRALALVPELRPAASYVSVVEASLYEATGQAHAALARRGLAPGTPAWEAALADEIAQQKQALHERVWRDLPGQAHLCWYPMSKRRGERDNWYALGMDERRGLMRGHGQIGARFRDQVVQVISGSTGLDDWEWSVDLYADDPLAFKKLVTAMRFDAASARFAEFGPFWLARRQSGDELAAWLAGA